MFDIPVSREPERLEEERERERERGREGERERERERRNTYIHEVIISTFDKGRRAYVATDDLVTVFAV